MQLHYIELAKKKLKYLQIRFNNYRQNYFLKIKFGKFSVEDIIENRSFVQKARTTCECVCDKMFIIIDGWEHCQIHKNIMVANAYAVMRKGQSVEEWWWVRCRRTQTQNIGTLSIFSKNEFFLDTKWCKLMYSQIFQNIVMKWYRLTYRLRWLFGSQRTVAWNRRRSVLVIVMRRGILVARYAVLEICQQCICRLRNTT